MAARSKLEMLQARDELAGMLASAKAHKSTATAIHAARKLGRDVIRGACPAGGTLASWAADAAKLLEHAHRAEGLEKILTEALAAADAELADHAGRT